MNIDSDALFAAARKVQANAYARYSNYFVGAAILDEAGKVHVGCNVENASFPEGNCAEASAIAAMVSTGARKIVAIAIVGDPDPDKDCAVTDSSGNVENCTPCGGCRQRIREFADGDTEILLINNDGAMKTYHIDDLLPESFRVPWND